MFFQCHVGKGSLKRACLFMVRIAIVATVISIPVSLTGQTPSEVQKVKVTVSYAKSKVPTVTQIEEPYSYSVTVDPWLFLITSPDNKENKNKLPYEVEWECTFTDSTSSVINSPVDFEITFNANDHFLFKCLNSATDRQNAKGRSTARSGQLIRSALPDSPDLIPHRRYLYTIKIYPPLPKNTPPQDRKDHYILIDPNYIVED